MNNQISAEELLQIIGEQTVTIKVQNQKIIQLQNEVKKLQEQNKDNKDNG